MAEDNYRVAVIACYVLSAVVGVGALACIALIVWYCRRSRRDGGRGASASAGVAAPSARQHCRRSSACVPCCPLRRGSAAGNVSSSKNTLASVASCEAAPAVKTVDAYALNIAPAVRACEISSSNLGAPNSAAVSTPAGSRYERLTSLGSSLGVPVVHVYPEKRASGGGSSLVTKAAKRGSESSSSGSMTSGAYSSSSAASPRAQPDATWPMRQLQSLLVDPHQLTERTSRADASRSTQHGRSARAPVRIGPRTPQLHGDAAAAAGYLPHAADRMHKDALAHAAHTTAVHTVVPASNASGRTSAGIQQPSAHLPPLSTSATRSPARPSTGHSTATTMHIPLSPPPPPYAAERAAIANRAYASSAAAHADLGLSALTAGGVVSDVSSPPASSAAHAFAQTVSSVERELLSPGTCASSATAGAQPESCVRAAALPGGDPDAEQNAPAHAEPQTAERTGAIHSECEAATLCARSATTDAVTRAPPPARGAGAATSAASTSCTLASGDAQQSAHDSPTHVSTVDVTPAPAASEARSPVAARSGGRRATTPRRDALEAAFDASQLASSSLLDSTPRPAREAASSRSWR